MSTSPPSIAGSRRQSFLPRPPPSGPSPQVVALKEKNTKKLAEIAALKTSVKEAVTKQRAEHKKLVIVDSFLSKHFSKYFEKKENADGGHTFALTELGKALKNAKPATQGDKTVAWIITVPGEKFDPKQPLHPTPVSKHQNIRADLNTAHVIKKALEHVAAGNKGATIIVGEDPFFIPYVPDQIKKVRAEQAEGDKVLVTLEDGEPVVGNKRLISLGRTDITENLNPFVPTVNGEGGTTNV